LLKRKENFITIACRHVETAQKLANGHPQTAAISLDATNETALDQEIAKHDLVISLIPYTHHAKVIKAAVKHRKHVVTTSYVSPAMQEFDQAYVELM
jgi:saccharopine dehydrogenase (NADP+, L-glutamate forming)